MSQEPTPSTINSAVLQWNEEGQPKSSQFDDFYFSTDSGLDESRYVFLKHNDLAQRWQKLPSDAPFCIIETGFGSGLNFLASWQLWQERAPKNAHLHFISCEKYPLTKDELARTLALWPQLQYYSEQLLQAYPPLLSTGFHRIDFDGVSLTLIIGDAREGLEQLKHTSHPLFSDRNRIADAWFLDGFSPSKNPEMWSSELFAEVAALSKNSATLATFTAASRINKALQAVGFTVQKSRGFGIKREMLQAHFTAPAQASSQDFKTEAFNSPHPAPWHLSTAAKTQHKTAVIIGGGLAGCHSARALAERGFKVTIIERHAQLAQEGSGNPQGMLYAKLSPRDESLPSFNLATLMYAQRHYRPFWHQPPEKNAGQGCGVMQLAHTDKEQKIQQKLRDKFDTQYPASDLIEFIDAARASDIAGVEIEHSGIHFKHAGWLSPQAVCRDLCHHANISVINHTEIKRLALENNEGHSQWLAYSADDTLVMQADVAIIATASDAMGLAQTAHLPLKPIRGQISYLPATPASRQLQTVVCAEGYLSPAIAETDEEPFFNGLGASFNLRDSNTELTDVDHQNNLDKLNNHTPSLAKLFDALRPKDLGGRVAFRCTTPDYLPLVGPVPIKDEFLDTFSLLRKNAKSSIPKQGPHYPNLYTSVGYGSRGLAYTPLTAQYLAALICAEPSPMPAEYLQSLHPGRFMIRDLIKNKI